MLLPQNVCHDWLMQRRAQREALTPEKMKRDQWLLSNSSLSLEEKKRKILKSLSRLEALGVLEAPHSHAQILHLIAKVSDHAGRRRGRLPSCSSSQPPVSTGHPPAASAAPAPGGGASEAGADSGQAGGQELLPQRAGGLLQRLHHLLSGQPDGHKVGVCRRGGRGGGDLGSDL